MKANKRAFSFTDVQTKLIQLPSELVASLKVELESFLSSIFLKKVKVLSEFSEPNKYLCIVSELKVVVHLTQTTFSQVKNKISLLKVFKNLDDDLVQQLKYDYGFNRYWYFVTYSESDLSCNLLMFLKLFQGNFPVEFILKLIIQYVRIGLSLKQLGIFVKKLPPEYLILSFFPCLNKNEISVSYKMSPLIGEKGHNYIEFTNKKLEPQQKDCNDKSSQDLYKSLGSEFCMSLASIIYCCLTYKTTGEFQDLSALNAKQLKSELKKLPQITGLRNFIDYLKSKSFKDLEKNRKISTWNYILGYSQTLPEIFSPSGLCTGYFCDSSSIINKTFQILLKHKKILENLKEKYFTTALQKKIVKHLTEINRYDIEILDFLYVFIEKVYNYKKSINISVYIPLVYNIFQSQLDFKSKAIFEISAKIIIYLQKGPTLSLLRICQQSGHFDFFYSKIIHNAENLNYALPYLGDSALDKLKLHLKTLHIGQRLSIIELFHQIPPHTKLQNPFEILSELENLLSQETLFLNLTTKENIAKRLEIFDIVYEVFIGINQARLANREGKCYENSFCYRICPVMIKCLYCSHTYCIICGRSHTYLNHPIEYLTHFKLKNRAFTKCSQKEIEPLADPLHLTHKMFPAYEQFPVQRMTLNNGVFSISTDWIKLHESPEAYIVYYSEVFFETLASEDFVIEFEGSKVVLNNNKAVCSRNKSIVCSLPKIGSGDNLGFGLTSDQYLFFTYNGFNLSKYIQLFTNEVRITINFENSPIKPVLVQPVQSLYTGESLLIPDKSSLFEFPKLLKNMTTLWKLRKLPEASQDITAKLISFKSLYKEEELISLPSYKKFLEHKQDNCLVF